MPSQDILTEVPASALGSEVDKLEYIDWRGPRIRRRHSHNTPPTTARLTHTAVTMIAIVPAFELDRLLLCAAGPIEGAAVGAAIVGAAVGVGELQHS